MVSQGAARYTPLTPESEKLWGDDGEVVRGSRRWVGRQWSPRRLTPAKCAWPRPAVQLAVTGGAGLRIDGQGVPQRVPESGLQLPDRPKPRTELTVQVTGVALMRECSL
jgi:hypothetical protein